MTSKPVTARFPLCCSSVNLKWLLLFPSSLMLKLWQAACVGIFCHCCSSVVFPANHHVKRNTTTWSRSLRFRLRIVMCNCCVVWSYLILRVCYCNETPVETSLEWWRLYSMSHSWHNPSLHGTGFSTRTRFRKCSGACEGWMWAGGGRQGSWGNHSDKWCISVLHCALCFDMTTSLWSRAVKLNRNKGWLYTEIKSHAVACMMIWWFENIFTLL